MSTNYYKKYTKREYAVKAIQELGKDGNGIYGYRGNNLIRIIARKIAKAIKYIQIIEDDKLYISNLAVVTDYVCTMNCEGCGQHTPYIKSLPEDEKIIDMDQVEKDLKKISDAVDGIGGYALANGEGFVNKGLSRLIDIFANDSKVIYMNVPSNGTVVPSEDLLKKMRQNDVSVTITVYDSVSKERRQKLLDALDNYGIRYEIFRFRKWYLHEYIKEPIFSIKEAKRKYAHCERFYMLLQGRLWKCVINATGIMAGLRPEKDEDSILVKNATIDEIREFIISKNNLGYIESCRHCRGISGPGRKEIKAGKQL